MSSSYKSLSRLCSRSNASSFILSTVNLGFINQMHDLSPMPSYDVFPPSSPHCTPNDTTMFLAEVSPASTACTTPSADDSASPNSEMTYYENTHEFSRLWSHRDSTTDSQPSMQWNYQQNNVSQPIAQSTGCMYNCITDFIEVDFSNCT